MDIRRQRRDSWTDSSTVVASATVRSESAWRSGRETYGRGGRGRPRYPVAKDKLPGGKYTADREQAHEQIVREALQKQVDAGAQKGDTAVILSGLPGAGKTESFNQVVDDTAVVHISPDSMKEELASRGLVDPPPGVGRMEAAPLLHEESSDMAKQLANDALGQGYNVVYDITGRSVASIQDRVDQAKAAGYRVVGVFVDAPIDQALQHASGRYERGLGRDFETARYTPPENITSMADPSGKYDSLNRQYFEDTKGSMDAWVRIDNSGSAPKVAETSPGALVDGKVPL
jgi:predicted kinase